VRWPTSTLASVPRMTKERDCLDGDLARGFERSFRVLGLHASDLAWYMCVLNGPLEPLHLLQR
jgi:hypothetical protein